jgi:Protein of unknown function (DUF4007)
MEKLYFSGHESFYCRYFWLKKGYDFVQRNHDFNNPNAVIELGVGKNMVAAIRHWLKAFGLVDDKEKPKPLTDFLFETNNGADQYLNDIGTVWLLHYLLVKTGRASIYSLVFNEFRKLHIEFTREDLDIFLRRKCEEAKFVYNQNTIKTDMSVLIRNYYRPSKTEKNINAEDEFSGVLLDLNILKTMRRNGVEYYKLESDPTTIPIPILFYCILDGLEGSKTITFHELLTAKNQIGSVFMLSAEHLYQVIQTIEQEYPITFTEEAGTRTLQLKTNVAELKSEVLKKYYNVL